MIISYELLHPLVASHVTPTKHFVSLASIFVRDLVHLGFPRNSVQMNYGRGASARLS
jgi:hypothetical protein